MRPQPHTTTEAERIDRMTRDLEHDVSFAQACVKEKLDKCDAQDIERLWEKHCL